MSLRTYRYMLFVGWEGRIVKNFDRGLENAAGDSIKKGLRAVY